MHPTFVRKKTLSLSGAIYRDKFFDYDQARYLENELSKSIRYVDNLSLEIKWGPRTTT